MIKTRVDFIGKKEFEEVSFDYMITYEVKGS